MRIDYSDTFKPNNYYRWLNGRGEIYVKHSKDWTFVENGQIFKGDFLNSADNIEEISFGCAINFEELPVNTDIDYKYINSLCNNLNYEQCFYLLPRPTQNDQGIYPIIKQGNTVNRTYIHNDGQWRVAINDWCGSKDQINLFEVHSYSLIECLRSVIFMMIVRDILPIETFLDFVEISN
jgi:hypothetical protein